MTTATPVAPAPKAPAKPKAKVTQPNPCKCGCKALTQRSQALYLSGHDARHAGSVARQIIEAPAKADQLLATLPTPKLRDKASGIVQAKIAKADTKARLAAARQEAKAAYDRIVSEAKVPKAPQAK